MNNPPLPLTAIVVGVKGMGAHQARILKNLPGYQLAGVCDLDEATAKDRATELGVKAWTDFSAALEEARPDVVAICTPNTSHAALTIQAANAGVPAIHCEKPMAVNLGDARRMTETCAQRGAILVVNHQRRIGHDLVRMRELIDSGGIGKLTRISAVCAGDFLSDGTHSVDSLLWLAGDSDPVEVEAEMDFYPVDESAPQGLRMRYGHPVEAGMQVNVLLKNGVRLEIATGKRQEKKAYQEYLAEGSGGRLWRVGDSLSPNLFIAVNGQPGDRATIFDSKQWFSRPVPVAGAGENAVAEWSAVEVAPATGLGAIATSYSILRDLLTGARSGPHPMNAGVALRGFELVMAVYESARLGRKIEMPSTQLRFPLDIIREDAAPIGAK